MEYELADNESPGPLFLSLQPPAVSLENNENSTFVEKIRGQGPDDGDEDDWSKTRSSLYCR